ncbi:low-affinity zinc ion transporter-like protein [Pyronema omphalodes]|nr:low-affinity zinc ion transporter-like protein [Pyronema omphalodes]
MESMISTLIRRDNGTFDAPPVECVGPSSYDGKLGVRIASIFVIAFASTLGALLPKFLPQLLSKATVNIRPNGLFFFFLKFFGSGVIIATAFIHLLAPSVEKFNDPCLENTPIADYPWSMAIALLSIFVIFYVDILSHTGSMRRANGDVEAGRAIELRPVSNGSDGTEYTDHKEADVQEQVNPEHVEDPEVAPAAPGEPEGEPRNPDPAAAVLALNPEPANPAVAPEVPAAAPENPAVAPAPEPYVSSLSSLAILEFGIIFHSILIGITLGVTEGQALASLFTVLTFHQLFEGLGLGSRLATHQWKRAAKWWSVHNLYVWAVGFGLSTPLGIVIGLGVRYSINDNARAMLFVQGTFDAFSAGILLYTGLVELIAKEVFQGEVNNVANGRPKMAFWTMVLGAGLMALLGRWA